MDTLQATLESFGDWNRAVVFLEDGTVLASTLSSVPETEIAAFLTAFDSYDDIFTNGLTFCSLHYSIFRFYPNENPPLIYGRRGTPEDSEGICLLKTQTSEGRFVFALITYHVPVLAPKAIPQLIEFAKENLTTL
eukprot:TRINITY_DN911_c2_g1_i1.p2 TRINITY_DN911_c2_g1~~TRINITY_DN911_c2_g1_i1.p2  ORF type:complete len:135 (+),score=23.61 TRINITY_DN911_c2_g1_i1:135-539(+)